ncbi:helix-turn-helix transcriptional regulator [Acidithiobacillus montserratensis]|uniref:Helix-turn-helix transcriptional regulator n=1 Tax=Acidithiobacillus montserratensis TaxID=2729135 RepID=A0ACD5HJE2_9PROT|nr:helix-turn-helix transcriptional regulator [Acidithiobacillus montserratensis]MBU2747836.1 helix-turn-helix transcriptional regulator [Acidithiobacillus montserratensis]
MDAKSFGAEIRKARRALGITQAELADRVGVSRATLIAYEQGVGLSVGVAGEIVAILGLQIQLSPLPPQEPEKPVVAEVPLLGNLRHKRFPRLEEVLQTTVGLC